MRGSAVRAVICCLMVCIIQAWAAESTESLMSSGGELLRSGAYSQAITRFKKVLARDPGNFEAQFNVAFSYLLWQRYKEAIPEFNKAAGINPNHADIWANLGVAYERLGQMSKAIDCFARSINLDPSNVDARLNLASMYANANRINEAITQFKEVVMIDGSNPVALTNLSKLLVGQKKLKEAKHYLREAIAFDPNNAEAHWVLGNIYWKQEKKQTEAIKEYEVAIKLEPTSNVYYENLALVLEEQDKIDEAIKVYEDFLIYLDDAFKKEQIEKRIDMLKNPSAGGGRKGGKDRVVFEQNDKEELKRLKKELRGEEAQEETKTMDVGTIDIMSDLEGLDSEDEGGTLLDLKEEAKKKAKTKE